MSLPIKADGVTTGLLSTDIINTPYGSSLARTVKLAVSCSDNPNIPWTQTIVYFIIKFKNGIADTCHQLLFYMEPCRDRGLNPRPTDLKTDALPLRHHSTHWTSRCSAFYDSWQCDTAHVCCWAPAVQQLTDISRTLDPQWKTRCSGVGRLSDGANGQKRRPTVS